MPRQPVYPKGLAVRGKRLWREVLAIRPRLGPGERVLLEEACRISDRLEALNEQISGAASPEFESSDGQRFVVVVDAAQQEARLSTVALRQVMMSLGIDKLETPAEPVKLTAAQKRAAAAAEAAADGEDADEDTTVKGGDPLDEITKRRQQRERPAG